MTNVKIYANIRLLLIFAYFRVKVAGGVHMFYDRPIEKEPSEEDVFSGAAHLITNIGTGAVICMSADVIPIDRGNWYVPAWII